MKPWEEFAQASPQPKPWEEFSGTAPVAKPKKLGADAFGDTLREELQNSGWFERNLAGAGSAVMSAVEGLKGLIPGVGSNKQEVEAQKIIADEAPVGNVVGNVAMLAPTAFIPGANTMTGAAAINAITSGLLTPGDIGERLAAAGYGAAGGAAGIGVGKAIGAGYRAAKAAAEPMTEAGRNRIIGRTMIRAAGDNADDVAARMAGATALVPGTQPTAAEVAESGGIAALQRAMSSANPEEYAYRFMKNADAREAALRSIAGTSAEKQAAIQAREGAAEALYKRAYDSDRMRQDVAQEALDRLAMARTGGIHVVNPTSGAAATGETAVRQVLDDPAAMAYMGIKNTPDQFAIAPAVQSEVTTAAATAPKGPGFAPIVVPEMPTPGLKALAERPVFASALQDAQQAMLNRGMKDVPLNSLQGLHLTKLSIDEALNGSAKNSALANYSRATLQNIKSQLVAELKQLSPLYDNARRTFADMSKPINQMDVGQYLLDKLEPAAREYGKLTGERANAFTEALRNSDRTVKLALKNKAPKGLADVLTPEQLAAVENVAKDLARVGNANDLGRGVGSNTFQNFAMDNLAAQSGMPSAVSAIANLIPGASAPMNIVKTLGGLVYRTKDEAMKRRMADVLLNPHEAAQLMREAQKQGLVKGSLAKLVGNDPVRLSDLLNRIGATRGILGASLAAQGQ